MKTRMCIALALAFALLVAACGGGATQAPAATEVPAATEEAQPTVVEETATAGLSYPRVELVTFSNDSLEVISMLTSADMFWPKLFKEPAKIITTEEVLPALISGEGWVGHESTSLFWAAMDQGSVDIVMIGIDKDNEIWILGSRPGIKTPKDLVAGSTVSGGYVGDWGELSLRYMLEGIGVDPNTLNIVAFGGGADTRMEALIAGQLDAGVLQPRNIGPLERAGGAILFNELHDVPQEAWVVTREFLENHRDAVCGFVLGRIQAKQWDYEGSDHMANQAAALEIGKQHGIDPTADELADWVPELAGNQSLDGGATIEELDQFQADLKTLKYISDGFEWRDHTDFSCVWDAQEALGLPIRPPRW